jgi:hypothetical protein
MARRGFLGRIVDRVRSIVAPPRQREEPPPPPPEPPEPTDSYRKIWREQRGQGSYRKNLEVFHNLVDEVEPDEGERKELWQSFVRDINRNRRSDPYRRQSTFNPFWQESGIAPDAMDWKKWRIAMGYTGERRSRTP